MQMVVIRDDCVFQLKIHGVCGFFFIYYFFTQNTNNNYHELIDDTIMAKRQLFTRDCTIDDLRNEKNAA